MGVTDEIFRIVSVRFSASHKPVATKSRIHEGDSAFFLFSGIERHERT